MSDAFDIPDASDDVATNNRSADAARYARDDADVLRKLMMAKAGRAWMHRMLTACHIFETSFAPGQPDTTAFRLGEENIGKRLLYQLMAASGDLYLEMMREAREEETRIAKVTRERNVKREERDVGPRGQFPDIMPPEGFETR